jgi:hypothetical protein
MYKHFLFIKMMWLFVMAGFSAGTQKWVISENSTLCVNGSTNINKFECDVPAYGHTDTLIAKSKPDKSIALTGSINLKIQSFDCHNAIMTHDLRNTLKEKQFPCLHISFISLNELPELTSKTKPITGIVKIEIAGVTKQFQVSYQVSADGLKTMDMVGSRDINFSDFDLTPPRKLGGIIRTNDKLSVVFHLKIRSIEQ